MPDSLNMLSNNEQLFQTLKSSLTNKKANIGIVGLGYVGLPLSLAFLRSGFNVIGFDIDERKISALKSGKSYIKHISDTQISHHINSGSLRVTSDFSLASTSDALILCVPTPLTSFREPDLTYITSTLKNLSPYLREGQIISLESTTYPGTTEEVVRPLVESTGLKAGESIFIAYSPEREDPGNISYSTQNIPKIVGGVTDRCLSVAVCLYTNVINELVTVSNTKVAEMTKLLENIHRAVNIGLMNELKPLADRMEIDLYEVIRAASTKPFGFVPYYPGPGLGGHCIPIDPFYLTWKAREFGMHTRFIELAGEINASMPSYVLEKVTDALNNVGKPCKDSRILVLGISYKKNVDDARESPSVEIIDLLLSRQALVDYCDPYFPNFPEKRKYPISMSSVDLSPDQIKSYDLVLLATDHDDFDYEMVLNYSRLIIDTRGRFEPSSKVFRA